MLPNEEEMQTLSEEPWEAKSNQTNIVSYFYGKQQETKYITQEQHVIKNYFKFKMLNIINSRFF